MKSILLIIVALTLFSCLENDNYLTDSSIKYGASELFLREFESNGDFINSYKNPALVEATEVYNNIDKYLLLDIRSENEFANGRIGTSINISADSLIIYFQNINPYEFSKIVIISTTGQHAAFCTSILRLLKYDNVYSMNFGMAYWNSQFSNEWFNALKTDLFWFLHDYYPKAEFSNLPFLQVDNVNETENQILNRARTLLSMEFDELCLDNLENELTINFTTIDYNYYEIVFNASGKATKDLSDEVTLICYSNISLYYINIEGIPFRSNVYHSHPVESVLYLNTEMGESDIRSGEFLQTIPSNEKIFVYSYSGQRSAYLTAYLRMLGYEAKSMVFGACNILYSSMLNNPQVEEFAFKPDLINSFEYESN